MKDIDFKDKSTPTAFGRWVVIVIVVLFSSLSFVLGYFVGKVGRTEPVLESAETMSQPKPPEAVPPPQAPQETPQSSGQTQQPGQPDMPAQTPPPATAVKPAKDMAGEVAAAAAPLQEQHAAEGVKGTPEAGGNEKRKTTAAGTGAGQKKAGIYTVQLGALKNAAEAKRLRSKFGNRGYKTFLIITKGRKHEKIYKVRIGEFKQKKDAEVLALRLKKSEGLRTFVTLKN